MLSAKKRMIAFVTAVCCIVTMVFGTGGDAETKNAVRQAESNAVAAEMSQTATGPAVSTTGPAASATGPAASVTGPAFNTADAENINLSQLYSVSVPVSQSAIYSFSTTTKKAYYQVRAFVTSGAAFHVEIYDAAAVNLIGSADLADSAYTRFALSASKKYFLRITGAGYLAGSILVSAVKDDFQDTRQTASMISFNKEYAVNTDVAGDVDFMWFTIGSQDATYYLTIEPTAGSSGTYELQDSAGNRISTYSGVTNKSTVVRKKLNLAKSRTYYFKVSSEEAYRQVVVSISMSINKYAIYYHLNGGKNVSSNPASYVATNTIHLKHPIRRKCTFAGWYTDAKFKNKISTIYGSAKRVYHLYAKWKGVSVKKTKIKSFVSTGKGKAKVKFKKLSGVKGYQIRLGLSSNLKKKTKSYNKTKTTVQFKKLKPGKRYYIAVRAYKKDSAGKKVYGAYTKIKSVKIKSAKTKSKKKDNSKKDKSKKSSSKQSSSKKDTSKKSSSKKSSSKKDTSKKSSSKKSSSKKDTSKKSSSKKSSSKKNTSKKSSSKKSSSKKNTSKKSSSKKSTTKNVSTKK